MFSKKGRCALLISAGLTLCTSPFAASIGATQAAVKASTRVSPGSIKSGPESQVHYTTAPSYGSEASYYPYAWGSPSATALAIGLQREAG